MDSRSSQNEKVMAENRSSIADSTVADSDVSTSLLIDEGDLDKWKQGYGCNYRQDGTQRWHGSLKERSAWLIAFLVQSVLLVLSMSFSVYLMFGSEQRVVTQHDVDVGCGAFPLGTDPSGYVPRDVGYPLRWTKWDEHDEYYISPATFDSWEQVQESAARLRGVHNDVFVNSNGQKATYLAYDGVRKELPPEAKQFGLELYGIQAFHQIHCVYVLLESVGWARYNRSSQWHGEHVAHCLNTLTQAATCLADSRPFAYVVKSGHRTDGQQNWCRDFSALREWVNDPIRDHNFHYELDSNDTDHFMPIYRNGSIAGKSWDRNMM